MAFHTDDPHHEDGEEIKSLEELGNPRPGQGIFEGFEPYAYTTHIGKDGLPVEDTPPWQSQDAAPIPLTPETVQCLPQPPSKYAPKGLSSCSHYKRQRCHNPQAPDRPLIMRFCTHNALRGINGACMALDDAGIFECEFRDPPDPRASLVLDLLDHTKMMLGRERLIHERNMGKVHGYRMFRTPEDVAAGRYTLDEGDMTESALNRKKVDPFAPDEE